eukprot:741459-Pyramimonas_sp.AAC.1
MAELRDCAYFSISAFSFASLFCPSARAGGVATLCPNFEKCPKRSIKFKNARWFQGDFWNFFISFSGDAWIANFNIHLHGLSVGERRLVALALRGRLAAASAAPTTRLAAVAGDLNLADMAPRMLDADPPINPLATLRDWRASRDAILSPVFSTMTEIVTPDPAHYSRTLGVLNTIDRIFASLPGWVCNQLLTSGQVSKFPEVPHAQGLSDHAPLAVSLAGSPPIPPGERPTPQNGFFPAT